MSLLWRFLILPAIAGLAFAASSLAITAGSTSAQTLTGSVSTNCTDTWPTSGSCTVTPNFNVPPGGSFTFTMPDGSTATVNCPSGCAAGATYTLTPSMTTAYASYSTPQTIVAGGACVNGSYPTAFGCTSATVSFAPYYSAPYYSMPYYSSVYYAPPAYVPPYFNTGYFPYPMFWRFPRMFHCHAGQDNDAVSGTTSDHHWDGMTAASSWSC